MENGYRAAGKGSWTDKGMVLYLAGYSVVSAAFLTRFPFVHSDESWLAGLSRDMMAAGSLSVTESFFDARMRYPHAIKSLFHLLQMGFIQVFGYSAGGVRLLSLAAGLVLLLLFYILMKKITGREKLSLAVMVLFSLDTEFIYASHFARQEILLGAAFVGGLLLLLREKAGIKAAAFAGILTGLSVGVHPNSFLLACSLGCVLLFSVVLPEKTVERGKNKSIEALFSYIGVTGLIAGIFVGISYFFDSEFPIHYFQNGAMEFDIDASLISKAGELGGFFQRLFQRASGTYYVTELRFSLLLFAFLALFLGVYALVMRKRSIGAVLFGILGLIGGMIIIGRYNQTSVFFFFPFGYLLFGMFLAQMEKPGRYLIFTGILGITFFISAGQIRPWLEKEGYETYLDEIKELVPANARAVANLNTEFYFEPGCLRDYRNLPYALEEGSLAEYMDKNKIEYVMYSTELDYLYEHRPYFNVIYGNTQFVPELKKFCEDQGEIIGEFTNTEYGSRVIGVMGQEAYSRVIVYKIRGAGD